MLLGKKRGPKNPGMGRPPPLFGQCPKENVFFLLMSSLTNKLSGISFAAAEDEKFEILGKYKLKDGSLSKTVSSGRIGTSFP